MKAASRILDHLLRICLYAGGALVFLVMMITVLDVVARYVFHTSWFDAIELTSIIQVFVVWLPMGFVTATRSHVSVEAITTRMPPGVKRTCEAISSFLCAGIFFIMARQGFVQAMDSLRKGEFFGAMELPRYFPKFALALGCTLTALSFTLLFVEEITGGGSESKPAARSE